jgi:hypothetical protein
MLNKKSLTIIFAAVIVILLAGSAATAYFLIKKQANIKLINQKNQARLSENSLSPEMEKQLASEAAQAASEEKLEAAIEASSSATSTVVTPNLSYSAQEATITPEVLIKPVAGYLPDYNSVYATSGPTSVATTTPGLKNIKINWIQAVPIKQRDFFSKKYKAIAALSSSSYEMLFKIPNLDVPGTYPWSIMKVGIISTSSDEFVGQSVYQIFSNCDGMFCSAPFGTMFVIADKKTENLIVISRYSKYDQGALLRVIGAPIFKDDDSLYVGQFENPNEISIPGIANKFTKSSDNYSAEVRYKFSGSSLQYVGDTSNGKRLYLAYDGCFVVYDDNGGSTKYDYNYGVPLSTMAATLDLTYKDGVKNVDDYVDMPVGGCGSHGCANLAEAKSSEVKVVGKFGNGDAAYEYRNSNATIKDYYQNVYSISENQPGQDKPSIADFMANNGIVLRKLPFNDFYLLYLKADYMPSVECGKPVIYLYPKKTEDVKVQVSPTGGLSVTEPAYNNGWLVQATPASDILNYADGKNYPYLFWEGKGLFYQRPSEGFMVARADVDKFLNEKLAALGLVPKEINDFKEYWLPKMQAKPYYFVTFLPQDQFNEIAPLSVNPKPDTVIRIFMDYQGLNQPEKVVEPVIKTPKRIGFTVVEWGGALGRK